MSDAGRVISDSRTMRALAPPVRLALLETLRLNGPLTATKAGELLDESPGNMSWHLQTLAKYGFVEEAEGGRGRSRPWRVVHGARIFETAEGDAETAAAGDALEATFMDRNMQRLREWWALRRSYPVKWRRAAFAMDVFTYLTAPEMEQLSAEIHELCHRYRHRVEDESARPKGALPVHFLAYGHPVPGGNGD
jgi:DNA-binding transcriptional ArsR family regulator